MAAGRGEATAMSGGTPARLSNGVATDDPPTPNAPIRAPTAAPDAVTSGQLVTAPVAAAPCPPSCPVGARRGRTYDGPRRHRLVSASRRDVPDPWTALGGDPA